MKFLRSLGYMEARMHYMHARLNGSTQACISIAIDGHIDIHAIYGALVKVVSEEPLLQAVIAESPTGPYFAHRPTVDLPFEVRTYGSGGGWLSVLNRENNIPLDPEQSLWRMALYHASAEEDESFIFLTMHHSIVDSYSIDSFVSRLFSAYGERGMGTGFADIGRHDSDQEFLFAKMRDGTVPLSAEERLPAVFQCSWEDFLRSVGGSGVAESRKFSRYSEVADRSTVTSCISLSEDTLSTVERYCDSVDITINSFLSAALVKAFATSDGSCSSVSLNTAFSVRRLCGVPSDRIGCYISVVPIGFAVEDIILQEDQLGKVHYRKLSQAVVKMAKHPRFYDASELTGQVDSLAKREHFSCDIGMTYGEFSVMAEYGDLRIASMTPTVNRAAGNAAIYVHVLRVRNRMSISFSHTSPNTRHSWAARIMANFVERISLVAPGVQTHVLPEIMIAE